MVSLGLEAARTVVSAGVSLTPTWVVCMDHGPCPDVVDMT